MRKFIFAAMIASMGLAPVAAFAGGNHGHDGDKGKGGTSSSTSTSGATAKATSKATSKSDASITGNINVNVSNNNN